MKPNYILLLAIFLSVVVLISGCIQQQTTTPSGTGQEQITQFPKQNPSNETEQSIPNDFPFEYINQSRDYLISKFGENLFESSIQFNRAYTMDFAYWGGCNEEVEAIGGGKKYVVEYKLNLSKYVALSSQDFYHDGYDVKVVYNNLGKIDCTDKVVDCVNHPEYCPPYKINMYESAIESFNKMCNRNFTRVNFEIYSNFHTLGYIEANESRFLWYFDDMQCGDRHCSNSWAVYIDPQTGKPIHDNYFADRNYYCDKYGKCEDLTSTARELGIDFRVCKETS